MWVCLQIGGWCFFCCFCLGFFWMYASSLLHSFVFSRHLLHIAKVLLLVCTTPFHHVSMLWRDGVVHSSFVVDLLLLGANRLQHMGLVLLACVLILCLDIEGVYTIVMFWNFGNVYVQVAKDGFGCPWLGIVRLVIPCPTCKGGGGGGC